MASFAFGFRLEGVHSFTEMDENGIEPKVFWMDALAQAHGLVKPPETDDFEDKDNQALCEQYYAAQQALIASLGCSIHGYGHEYSQEYFVELDVPGERTYELCKKLDLEAMKAVDTPENRERLRHFCAVMGIEYCEPSWCLLRYINLD